MTMTMMMLSSMIRMMMTMRMIRMMMMIRMIRMMLTLTMAESTRGVLPTAGTGSQHKKSCCYREETLRDGDDDVGNNDDGDGDDDGYND